MSGRTNNIKRKNRGSSTSRTKRPVNQYNNGPIRKPTKKAKVRKNNILKITYEYKNNM